MNFDEHHVRSRAAHLYIASGPWVSTVGTNKGTKVIIARRSAREFYGLLRIIRSVHIMQDIM
jgi:hypothetical protein